MKDKFEDKLLDEIIAAGIKHHAPLVSVWNNSRQIIRDKVTGAFYSYMRCPNERAAIDLAQWAGLSVDFNPNDAGNEAFDGYDCGDVNNIKIEY